ncbi:MAG: hypothetical protein J0I29_05800 [Rhizobiales bacterium]|nr:hypothetical protein [Hyphomicrobiales bacterium]
MTAISLIQSQAISARMALIVGADNYDRLFAGVEFSEVDDKILYVFAPSEEIAAEIEDTFSLHLIIVASDILKHDIDFALVLPRVLH